MHQIKKSTKDQTINILLSCLFDCCFGLVYQFLVTAYQKPASWLCNLFTKSWWCSSRQQSRLMLVTFRAQNIFILMDGHQFHNLNLCQTVQLVWQRRRRGKWGLVEQETNPLSYALMITKVNKIKLSLIYFPLILNSTPS